MTRQLEHSQIVPQLLARTRDLVEPALRAAIGTLADDRMRLIASYQMGWCDAEGNPTEPGGKAIRPALAILSAEAAIGTSRFGLPAAVAVELVHNFSLLHDDVMDRDLERRHRPTGWLVFGDGDAILAGNAMLTLAMQVLDETGIEGRRSLPHILNATQLLISGQSRDLWLEGRDGVSLQEVLDMEAGKTAALLACATSVGALAAGAPDTTVRALERFGHELGIAFQLVDDVLGVVGDPARTGKSSSSDVRAGKRSAPIVAALTSDTPAGRQLAEMFAAGRHEDEDDVILATGLIKESGGLDWAIQEAEARLTRALDELAGHGLAEPAVSELAAVAAYIVDRDR
ncbi:MAG: geranylgeranyl diphosphate synthase, type [Pseudonocardiales bacterium]|jgi:geranylgeranyl diphosphate synthase type I|nr:geranylgeranyl diphosphate synthase, type [Pseudonocardiales bacterium]